MVTREDAKLEVGPGWGRLVDRLYDELPSGVMVLQVKEKFGALRVYTTEYTDQVERLLTDLESASVTVCEACGQPGQLGEVGGWYKTRCDDCRSKPEYANHHAQNAAVTRRNRKIEAG